MSPFLTLVTGLGTGLALIVAIGAQNAFVLRQGLRREHVGAVVAVCAASDVVLVLAGTAGLGALVTRVPALLDAVRWGGAAFLLVLAVMAARRVLRPAALDPAGDATASLATAAGTALALTWLNPHVYLDTVLLLGSVAAGHGDARWWFATGAVVASIGWFTALGYGARALAPVFARPVAWRVLDGVIAVVMAALAVSLVATA
ncbi:LysE/ArgO family amino acid transporter [Oerskovia flava]|uniref:LysE/ArgO family amino acid transporter n=1 Tax=Oerskovia flava TaxID=2986422 RepID=UPI002240AD16|nr:LysE family transporter [Oerskovia sp. JB1-3-2]